MKDLLADGLTLRRMVDATTQCRKYVVHQKRPEVERDGRMLKVVAQTWNPWSLIDWAQV